MRIQGLILKRYLSMSTFFCGKSEIFLQSATLVYFESIVSLRRGTAGICLVLIIIIVINCCGDHGLRDSIAKITHRDAFFFLKKQNKTDVWLYYGGRGCFRCHHIVIDVVVAGWCCCCGQLLLLLLCLFVVKNYFFSNGKKKQQWGSFWYNVVKVGDMCL